MLPIPSKAVSRDVWFLSCSILKLPSQSNRFAAPTPQSPYITKNFSSSSCMACADVIHLLPALPLLLSILLSGFSNVAPGMKVNLARISTIFASGFVCSSSFFAGCACLWGWHLDGSVQKAARTQAGPSLGTVSKFLLLVKWGGAGRGDPDAFPKRQQHMKTSASCMILSSFLNYFTVVAKVSSWDTLNPFSLLLRSHQLAMDEENNIEKYRINLQPLETKVKMWVTRNVLSAFKCCWVCQIPEPQNPACVHPICLCNSKYNEAEHRAGCAWAPKLLAKFWAVRVEHTCTYWSSLSTEKLHLMCYTCS